MTIRRVLLAACAAFLIGYLAVFLLMAHRAHAETGARAIQRHIGSIYPWAPNRLSLIQLAAQRMPSFNGDDDTINRRACDDASSQCRPVYIFGIPTADLGFGLLIIGFILLLPGLGALAALLGKAEKCSWLHIIAILIGGAGIYLFWHAANLTLTGYWSASSNRFLENTREKSMTDTDLNEIIVLAQRANNVLPRHRVIEIEQALAEGQMHVADLRAEVERAEKSPQSQHGHNLS